MKFIAEVIKGVLEDELGLRASRQGQDAGRGAVLVLLIMTPGIFKQERNGVTHTEVGKPTSTPS